jgi:hypothetical protein
MLGSVLYTVHKLIPTVRERNGSMLLHAPQPVTASNRLCAFYLLSLLMCCYLYLINANFGFGLIRF